MDALLELFSFQGRANRSWYFWHIVIDDFVIFALALAMIVMGVLVGVPLVALPLAGVMLGGIAAAIAVTVKRLHDIDRPGWHWFLLAIPLYNIYLGFKLLFERGTQGDNRFGPDPLAYRPALAPVDEPPPDLSFLEG